MSPTTDLQQVLVRMFLRCVSMVRSEMNKDSAMAWLDFSSATRRRIAFSRVVSSTTGGAAPLFPTPRQQPFAPERRRAQPAEKEIPRLLHG
ncbi:hypothetical protein [Hymenobacter terricola]|uniref:hypothetical protein n=1 Tax=Hymenobacter terricola TaxID=2819236 RepID=UPI00293D5EEA|nr:hypothetical protein [Hymenobacter terricola]